MSSITPDIINIRGHINYETTEEVLDALSKLKEIESLSNFNNQIVDLEAEEPMIGFSQSASDEYDNSLTLESAPSNDQLPQSVDELDEESESIELELNTIQLTGSFVYEDQDLLEAALEEVINFVEEIQVEQLYFGLSLERSFNELAKMKSLNDATEIDLSGIQFEEEEYVYSFQEANNGTTAYAFLQTSEKIDDDTVESFIQDQLDQIAPVIERVCDES